MPDITVRKAYTHPETCMPATLARVSRAALAVGVEPPVNDVEAFCASRRGRNLSISRV